MEIKTINPNIQISTESSNICKNTQDTAPKQFYVTKVTENEEVSKEELKKSLERLNKHLKVDNVHAEYFRHEKFGDLMIKIIHNDTKEVIMEFPSKKVLDVVANLCEMNGTVFDKRV